MRLYSLLLCLVAFSSLSLGYAEEPSAQAYAPLLIYDTKPAATWDQGHGVGNGRMAALSYGAYPQETIVLNEGTIFAKPAQWNEREGVAEAMQLVRQLAREGKHAEADDALRNKVYSNNQQGSYQTGGALEILHLNAPPAKKLERSLDLSIGKAQTKVDTEGWLITWELITPRATDIIALLLKTTDPKGLHTAFKMTHPQDKAQVLQDGFLLVGQASNGGTKFQGQVQIIPSSQGRLTIEGDQLILQGAKEALILISYATDYHLEKPNEPLTEDLALMNAKHLKNAARKGWEVLLEENEMYMAPRMQRCQLDIGATAADIQALTTAERLALIKQGGEDPDLVELLFQFGRFCALANTRPNGLPSGLQGLWNPSMNPPWEAVFFLNVNCQMNQWPLEVTGLGEYHKAFIELIKRSLPEGLAMAQHYGYDGFLTGHYIGPWLLCDFMGNDPEWSSSIASAAWASAHLVDHYRFNRDATYLKTGLPLIRENVRFLLSWLEKDSQTAKWISGPASSPETSFFYTDQNGIQKKAYTSLGTSYDQLVAHECLKNYLFMCKELNIKDELLEQADLILKDLLLPAISKEGHLMEWIQDWENVEKGHRHFSHCYGIFPGYLFNSLQDKDHAQAVEKAVDNRIAHGGAYTGWSAAWTVNLYAHLGRADDANKHLKHMMSSKINPNLFDMHPPFQIDGNFGITAGIANMLIQSNLTEGEKQIVRIAPALPKDWARGSISGLRARGGLIVDLVWTPTDITANCTSQMPGLYKILYGDQYAELNMKSDEQKQLNFKR